MRDDFRIGVVVENRERAEYPRVLREDGWIFIFLGTDVPAEWEYPDDTNHVATSHSRLCFWGAVGLSSAGVPANLPLLPQLAAQTGTVVMLWPQITAGERNADFTRTSARTAKGGCIWAWYPAKTHDQPVEMQETRACHRRDDGMDVFDEIYGCTGGAVPWMDTSSNMFPESTAAWRLFNVGFSTAVGGSEGRLVM